MGNNYVPTEIENNEMTEESRHCKYCMCQQNPFITLSLGSIKKHRIISEYYMNPMYIGGLFHCFMLDKPNLSV